MNIRKLVTLLVLAGLLLAAIAPVIAQEEPLKASTDFYATAKFRVNVRSGPGVQYTVLGLLNPEDAVDITGRGDETNSWLRINWKGQEGWVSFNTVNVTGDPDDAPIVEAGPSAVLRTGATTTTVELTDVTVVTRATARLRADSSVRSETLATIPPDTELKATARTASNNWVQVTFEGKTGWVSAGLLNFTTGNIANLPLPGAAATGAAGGTTVTTTDLSAVLVFTKVNTNMRASASTDGEVLAVIPFGTQLKAEARTEAKNWIKVTFEGKTGWVSSGNLNFASGNLELVPVSE